MNARVLGFLLAGFGTFMLIQLAPDLLYPWEPAKIKSATAEVIKLEPGTQRRRGWYRHGHYMTYRFEVKPGETYQGKVFTQSESDRQQGVGRKLAIEYHVDHPARNRLAGHKDSQTWMYYILAMVYLALVVIGCMYLFTGRDVFTEWKLARQNAM